MNIAVDLLTQAVERVRRDLDRSIPIKQRARNFWAGVVVSVDKVIERLGTTESTTLTIKREDGGKIRVASMLWEDAKVILRDEVLVVRNVDGCQRPPPA